MNYQKELELLKQTVGTLFEETEKQQKNIGYKDLGEIVTSSDLFIEQELIKAIKEVFPDDHFHSEEFNKNTKLKDRTWIIDPIDGTSNYAHKLDLFVNQIAFYDKGDIVLSFVHVPRAHKTFYAIKGEGAYMNDQKITVTQSSAKNKLMSLVGISHQTEKNKDLFYQVIKYGYYNNVKVRMLGTLGYEMTAVAEGSFVMLYTDVKNLWDVAPGSLLIKEAGGVIFNEKGEPYQLGDDHMFCFCDENLKHSVFEFLKSGV